MGNASAADGKPSLQTLPSGKALPAPNPGSLQLSPLPSRPRSPGRKAKDSSLFDLTPKSEAGSSNASSKRESARGRSLGADSELKGTLHTLLGTEWKELEYGEDGKPKSFVPSKNGLGRKADELLAELADASQNGQTMILAKLMLQTNARLDKLTEALMASSSSPFEA